MIIDSIANSSLYNGVHPLFNEAFEWLKTTDLKTIENGKYPIKGDDLIAAVFEHEGKTTDEAVIETHTKFIDIQYVISGEELMGYTLFTNQKHTGEKPESDCLFYKEEMSYVKVTEGMFAVFFPQDMHQPTVLSKPGNNKKVVIKVKI